MAEFTSTFLDRAQVVRLLFPVSEQFETMTCSYFFLAIPRYLRLQKLTKEYVHLRLQFTAGVQLPSFCSKVHLEYNSTL